MLEKNDWAAAGVQTAARTPAAHAAPARKRASIARPRMIECQMSGSIPSGGAWESTGQRMAGRRLRRSPTPIVVQCCRKAAPRYLATVFGGLEQENRTILEWRVVFSARGCPTVFATPTQANQSYRSTSAETLNA